MTSPPRLRIGSRQSLLAQLQTALVVERLRQEWPDLTIEISLFESRGDSYGKKQNMQNMQNMQNIRNGNRDIEEHGIFTRELTRQLLDRKIDAVIHSYKDLELETSPQTEIFSLLERADQRDLLLIKRELLSDARGGSREDCKGSQGDDGACRTEEPLTIYSSSPRRAYNLSLFLPYALPCSLGNRPLCFQAIRGNILTRLRKLQASSGAGLVIAKAAMDRLLGVDSLSDPAVAALLSKAAPGPGVSPAILARSRREISAILQEMRFMVLPLSLNPTAPGQGALAVELRRGEDCSLLFEPLRVEETDLSVERERQLLSLFGGGCHQKLGISFLRRPFGWIGYIRGLPEDWPELPPRLPSQIKQRGQSEKRGQIEQRGWREERGAAGLQAAWLEAAERPGRQMPGRRHAWPLPGEDLQTKRTSRSPGQAEPPPHIWVSRREAWPRSWGLAEKSTIWCSGTKTWFQLAALDIWVHGCSDSLGEEEPAIDLLLGRKGQFVKLTHQRAAKFGSKLESLVTYDLSFGSLDRIREQQGVAIGERRYFYWKSASRFDLLAAAFPRILQAQHACGPGLTYKYMSSRLSRSPHLFLSYEDWLASIGNS